MLFCVGEEQVIKIKEASTDKIKEKRLKIKTGFFNRLEFFFG